MSRKLDTQKPETRTLKVLSNSENELYTICNDLQTHVFEKNYSSDTDTFFAIFSPHQHPLIVKVNGTEIIYDETLNYLCNEISYQLKDRETSEMRKPPCKITEAYLNKFEMKNQKIKLLSTDYGFELDFEYVWLEKEKWINQHHN